MITLQEANKDLKKCLRKPKQTGDTEAGKIAGKRKRDKNDDNTRDKTKNKKKDKKGEAPPGKKAKPVAVAPKEESDDDDADDDADKGPAEDEDGDEEPHVPTPPSDADADSSPAEEPEGEPEDDDAATEGEGEQEDDDDDDDDSDDDVFTGSYKIAKKSVSRDELLEALPPKLASQRSKIEDSLLATLPQDLSQGDFDNWIGVLIKEEMWSLDEVKGCRGLEGPLSSHLSVSKSYYNKLSIKGKKLFDAWVDGLRFPEARLVRAATTPAASSRDAESPPSFRKAGFIETS
eukprot:s4447_g1.t1